MANKVYLRHARALKYCSQGIIQFCKKYDIDFRDFVKNGIDAELLLKRCNNDYLAANMVELSKKERS